MRILVLNDAVPYSCLETLSSVAPATIDVHCKSVDEAEEVRKNLLAVIGKFTGINLTELGDVTAFVSEVAEMTSARFTIVFFGSYIPAVMDVKEYFWTAYPDLTYNINYNTEPSLASMDSEYYHCTENLAVDAFSFVSQSGDRFWKALERCVDWQYTEGVYSGDKHASSGRAPTSLLNVYGVQRSKMYDADSWGDPEVDVPAMFLFTTLNEDLFNAILQCKRESDGFIHISVDADEDLHDYSRFMVRELLALVDTALCEHDDVSDIDWDVMHSEFEGKLYC